MTPNNVICVTTASLLSPCRRVQSRRPSHGFVSWKCCCDARTSSPKIGRIGRPPPRASSCPRDKVMLMVPRLAALCPGLPSSAAFSWHGCPAEPAGSAGSRPRWPPAQRSPRARPACKMHRSVSWRESRAAARHPAAASPCRRRLRLAESLPVHESNNDSALFIYLHSLLRYLSPLHVKLGPRQRRTHPQAVLLPHRAAKHCSSGARMRHSGYWIERYNNIFRSVSILLHVVKL